MAQVDVVILGGGPAGTAAAIECRARGLNVRIIEADPTRHWAGETHHPGSEMAFRHLGVWNAVKDAAVERHKGIRVGWRQAARLQRYSGSMSQAWLGLQIPRSTLHHILRDRALAVGALWSVCRPVRPQIRNGRICGVETDAGFVRAHCVIDATGRSAWLRHQLGLQRWRSATPLFAAYGYVEANGEVKEGVPRLQADTRGWTWQARIAPTTVAWVRITSPAARVASTWLPPRLRACPPLHATRFADVTWSVVERPAGPGYFVTGDAAARLCPARSSGILHALLSGVVAATSAAAIIRDGAPSSRIEHLFTRFVHRSFWLDAERLNDIYRVFPWWQSATAETKEAAYGAD